MPRGRVKRDSKGRFAGSTGGGGGGSSSGGRRQAGSGKVGGKNRGTKAYKAAKARSALKRRTTRLSGGRTKQNGSSVRVGNAIGRSAVYHTQGIGRGGRRSAADGGSHGGKAAGISVGLSRSRSSQRARLRAHLGGKIGSARKYRAKPNF